MKRPCLLANVIASAILLLGFTTIESADSQIQIVSINPPAITYGQPNEIVISGQNLSQVSEVIFTCKCESKIKSKSADGKSLVLTVEPLAREESGINLIRLIGPLGASPFYPVSVDPLPNQAVVADKKTPVDFAEQPIAVYGRISGQQKAIVEFKGKQGQSFLCGVESNRLGSKMRPELSLLDARGRQLTWAQPQMLIGGDARFAFKLPADGTYTIELHDQLNKAPANSLFRIKLGAFIVADQVVYRTDGRKALNLTQPNQSVEIEFDPAQAILSKTISKNATAFTGWRPSWLQLAGDEFWENGSRPIPTPSKMKYPIAINGQIGKRGEVDEYSIGLSDRLHIAVLAAQLGSPLDAVVTVLDQNNKVLANNDDSAQSVDPIMQVNVPKGTKSLRVRIKDLLGRGGDQFVYRMEIGGRNQGIAKLTMNQDHVAVFPGSHTLIRVQADRRGHQGPIELKMGHPQSLKYYPQVIPAGRNSTFVAITARGPFKAESIGMLGSREPAGYSQVMPNSSVGKNQPLWMRAQMTAGPAVEPDFVLNAGKPKRLFWFPKIQKIDLTIHRKAGIKNRLRVTLETTQNIKQVKQGKKNVPDPKTTIRFANKTLDLAADVKQKSFFIFAPAEVCKEIDFVILARPLLLMIADPKKPFSRNEPYNSNAQRFARQ